MQKRLITGLIVVFLGLAVQDRFSTEKLGAVLTRSDLVRTKSSALLLTAVPQSTPTSATHVVRVVDGDTIVVRINGVAEKIRLIGVDTPETVDPRGTVQCFGEEASVFTKSLLENTFIQLEADSSQGNRDKYGRLLRYVFLEDGTLVNKIIIEEGYGHEYTYRLPYQYQKEFKDVERSARKFQKGLWAQGVCGA